MLPFIPLHFLCTHFWQLAHGIELLPSPLPHTTHGHLKPSALPSTIHHFGFIHIYSHAFILHGLPSVLWCCWLGGRKGIHPVKKWVVGCLRGCLGWDADLHIARWMPLPLTVSCSSKSRLVLTFLVLPFWYLLIRVVPDIFQKSSKTTVCYVCACVCAIP